MMALEGVRDVEAKEGTTHSSERERRERGQHYQETGREGPGAVRLVVGRAVWVVRIVWIPRYDLVEVEAVVVIVGRGTPDLRADQGRENQFCGEWRCPSKSRLSRVLGRHK